MIAFTRLKCEQETSRIQIEIGIAVLACSVPVYLYTILA
jgi:hypothetical protein